MAHTSRSGECAEISFVHFSIMSAVNMLSAVGKTIYSPVSASRPALRAEDTPPFCLWITLMRSSFAAKLSHNEPLLSVLPSLTRMI